MDDEDFDCGCECELDYSCHLHANQVPWIDRRFQGSDDRYSGGAS